MAQSLIWCGAKSQLQGEMWFQMTYCTVHADEKLMSLREYAKAIVRCTFNGKEHFHLCFDSKQRHTNSLWPFIPVQMEGKEWFAFTSELYIQAVIAILMTDRWSVCFELRKMQLYTDRILQNKLCLLLVLVTLHTAALLFFRLTPKLVFFQFKITA